MGFHDNDLSRYIIKVSLPSKIFGYVYYKWQTTLPEKMMEHAFFSEELSHGHVIVNSKNREKQFLNDLVDIS